MNCQGKPPADEYTRKDAKPSQFSGGPQIDASEIAADIATMTALNVREKYLGKFVDVAGSIRNVYPDGQSATVFLKAGSTEFLLYLNPVETPKARDLRLGSFYRFRGRIDRIEPTLVTIMDCSIVGPD